MANFADKLALVISGDSSGAITSLKKVSSTAETELGKTKASGGKLQGAFSGVTQTIESIPAPLIAAGGAALAFGASAVHAAIEGQVAHAKLETAIKNNGDAYSTYGAKIDEASQKAAKLGFENDEVEASVAKLIPATHSVEKAIGLQGLAMDIARQKGIDLGTATQSLVQVEAGRYTALLKSGIVTKEQVKNFKSSADAVKYLASVYGGAASRYADTFAGKQAALNAQVQNFKEKIGGIVLPAFTDTLGTAADAAGLLNTGLDKASHGGLDLGKAFGFAEQYAGALATSGISLIVKGLSESNDKTKSASDVAKNYADALKKVQEASASGNTEKLAAAQKDLAAASKDVKKITNDVTTATNQDADAAKDAASAKKLLADQENALITMYKRNTDGLLGLAQAQQSAKDSTGDLTAKALLYVDASNKNAAAHGRNKEAAAQFLGAQSDLDKQILTSIGTTEQAAEAYVRFTDKNKGAALEQDVANAKTKAARDELDRLKLKFPELSPVIDGYLAKLHLIPKSINTEVTVNGSRFVTDVHGNLVNSVRGKRAAGGPVAGGSAYLVGEKGPELFVPKSSGTIIPNGALRKASSARGGYGGDVQVIVHVNNPVGNGQEIAYAMIDALEMGQGANRLRRVLNLA